MRTERLAGSHRMSCDWQRSRQPSPFAHVRLDNAEDTGSHPLVELLATQVLSPGKNDRRFGGERPPLRKRSIGAQRLLVPNWAERLDGMGHFGGGGEII